MNKTEQFNLSEKIIPPTCHKNYENIRIEHVKQAVKLLKEEIMSYGVNAGIIDKDFVFKEIDKIFGDKLI